MPAGRAATKGRSPQWQTTTSRTATSRTNPTAPNSPNRTRTTRKDRRTASRSRKPHGNAKDNSSTQPPHGNSSRTSARKTAPSNTRTANSPTRTAHTRTPNSPKRRKPNETSTKPTRRSHASDNAWSRALAAHPRLTAEDRELVGEGTPEQIEARAAKLAARYAAQATAQQKPDLRNPANRAKPTGGMDPTKPSRPSDWMRDAFDNND